jgi:hypothetical protein
MLVTRALRDLVNITGAHLAGMLQTSHLGKRVHPTAFQSLIRRTFICRRLLIPRLHFPVPEFAGDFLIQVTEDPAENYRRPDIQNISQRLPSVGSNFVGSTWLCD